MNRAKHKDDFNKKKKKNTTTKKTEPEHKNN